jgi:4-hydroxybenzoate polyprenyltransferase
MLRYDPKAILILGRVSNLPTVWSNCLAAWLLGGGGTWGRFAVVCLGATLLYSGGMFLNDAFDVEFDREHRPERPIPSGALSLRFVWAAGSGLLGLGWGVMIPLGTASAVSAFGLLTMIVIYDASHKRTFLAPALMAGCRYLLYIMAASAAKGGVNLGVLWPALALAAYVGGLSCLARVESTRDVVGRWPLALLFVPAVLALATRGRSGLAVWILAAGLVAWVVWCLRRGPGKEKHDFGAGVAGLLAGIVLVDWLAAVGAGQGMSLVFAGLFLLAKLTQRLAPAT